MGKYGGPERGPGVIKDPLDPKDSANQGVLFRELFVGFYHGLGLEDDFKDTYNPSEYRFNWRGPEAAIQRYKGGKKSGKRLSGEGTFVWEPKATNIANIENTPMTGESQFTDFNRMLSGVKDGGPIVHGGAAPFKRRAQAAHWVPGYQENDEWGEQIKKEMLPNVTWDNAKYGGFSLNLGRFGAGRGNDQTEYDTAKRYVWKWIANPKSGWGGGRVPISDAMGIMEDYTRMIRKAGLMKIQPQANVMLQRLLQGVSNTMSSESNKLVVQKKADVDSGSAEELALRLWPYIKDRLDTNMNINKILIEGTEDYYAAVQGGNDILGKTRPPAAHLRTDQGFDIVRDMRVWEELQEAIMNSTVVGLQNDLLKNNVEVTEQVNRILGRYKGSSPSIGRGSMLNVDWHEKLLLNGWITRLLHK